MDKIVRVNSDEYEIVRLLGHGKGAIIMGGLGAFFIFKDKKEKETWTS